MNKTSFPKSQANLTQPETPASAGAEGVYKTVRNCSVQGLSIIVKTESSSKSVWLTPKMTIRILESQVTQQMINLHKRRLISISN